MQAPLLLEVRKGPGRRCGSA